MKRADTLFTGTGSPGHCLQRWKLLKKKSKWLAKWHINAIVRR